MRFNIDHVRQFVDRDTIDPHTKLKEVSWFAQESHKNRLQSKALCLTILQVKTPTASIASKGFPNKSSYNQNKKTKLTVLPANNYHRYFLCADVSNPPHCFALITHSVAETMGLTTHLSDESYIGMFFYMIEPNLITSTIGEYLHVVDYKRQHFLPLKVSANIFSRPTSIVLPATSEETFYFVLEHETITITKSDSTDDTCKGFSCDRQKPKAQCSCLTFTGSNALVYQFDIEFAVDRTQFKRSTYVSTLSSFRTCTVFFHNFVEYCNTTNPKLETKMFLRRRSQIRRITKYINNHGGWKLIGWCKKGMLQIDGEAEKIPNQNIGLHLSYAYPQDPQLLDTDELAKLQIRCDFGFNDNQLHNLDDEPYNSGNDSSTSSEPKALVQHKQSDRDGGNGDDDGNRNHDRAKESQNRNLLSEETDEE